MYNKKYVSVVLATYREKNSIKQVIDDFYATGYVDEVIVVNNNAENGTDKEVNKTQAKLIYEKKQGHGYALLCGIRKATGDYVILCEADGTYLPKDIKKFLAYGEDFPVVLGTRTNKSLAAKNSAMFFLRRLADIIEGKIIQILFLTNTITDVGCTYKLLRRETIRQLDPHWLKGDSHFVTEVTLQVAARKIPFIEIPVAFHKRIGESAATGNLINIIKWGYKLFIFILYFWFRWRIIQLIQSLRSRKLYDNIS